MFSTIVEIVPVKDGVGEEPLGARDSAGDRRSEGLQPMREGRHRAIE
jgi:hypothetical protein